jgi:cytochrome P450 family 6
MSLFVFLTAIFIGLVLIALNLYKKTFEYWKTREVPNVEPEFLHGNTRGLGKTYHSFEFMKKVYNELKDKGPVGGVHISIRPTAIITDLDLVKTILVKDFKYFSNRKYFL